MQREAQWYGKNENGSLQCTLCPHYCTINHEKTGLCRVRKNIGDKLITEAYHIASSIRFDPIEKKPLYHFYPGSVILSIGTFGCNLRCFFCQNCTISQTGVKKEELHELYTPEKVIHTALSNPQNIGIAFTYNEPVVWYEYMEEIALLAKQNGLKTVMVTNGFINPEPLNRLFDYMDAFSVDLKAFTDDFYTKVTSSKLEPVKDTLRAISKSGKHLEVVNLVIPGLNDDEVTFTEMVKWIATELGDDTVLHLSRYFPNYKLTTEATPGETIRQLKRIAEKYLRWVYAGNIFPEKSETNCPNCGNNLISRVAYNITLNGIDNEGKCRVCGNFFLKKV